MIKFVLENFDTIFRNEKSLESLNKIILDLAIRGKLVEQNPEDEPASELLNRIKEEKERLIKEKVIKKEKELPKIEEDEIPFEIPESWEWVRLGEIVKEKPRNGYSPKSVDYITEIKTLKLGATTYGIFDEKQFKYIDERIPEDSYLWLEKNDILIQRSNALEYVGVSCIFNSSKKFIYPDLMMKIKCCNGIEPKYIDYTLKTKYMREYFRNKATGTSKTMPKINQETVINAIIPLPNLKEQQRIVEKVERLQELIKNLKEVYLLNEESRLNLKKSLLVEIEKSNSDKELLKNLEVVFSNFDKVIRSKEDIKDIRNLILSLAIKGKLVEQNPEDEPASELLKRIKEEKERLIKEKVIKKEKELPKIEKDEIPFEIPESWEWVRLGEIGNIFNGNSISEKIKKEKYENLTLGLNYIATKDIDYPTSKINYDNGVKIPHEEIEKFKIAHKGSILICSEGGSAGKKIGIAEEDICFGNKLYALEKYYLELNNKFIFYTYKTSYFYGNFKENETGIIGGVSINKFKNIIIPIPPLVEQQRIVERVEKLMNICDMLEEKIVESERVSEKLLESLIR